MCQYFVYIFAFASLYCDSEWDIYVQLQTLTSNYMDTELQYGAIITQ